MPRVRHQDSTAENLKRMNIEHLNSCSMIMGWIRAKRSVDGRFCHLMQKTMKLAARDVGGSVTARVSYENVGSVTPANTPPNTRYLVDGLQLLMFPRRYIIYLFKKCVLYAANYLCHIR